MQFTPMRGKAFIKLDKFEANFYGGCIERPQIAYDKPMIGEVLAIGRPHYAKKKNLEAHMIDVGDTVMIPWATGQELTAHGHIHIICDVKDILAKVDR